MNPVHGGVCLLGEALIKFDIILLVKIVFVSEPNCFIGIDLVPFELSFFNFFLWLIFFFGNFDIFIGLVFFFRSINFSFNFFLQINGEIDKLGIFFNKILDFVLVKELLRILFEVNSNFRSSSERLSFIFFDSIRGSCLRNPFVLDIFVTFCDDLDLISC